MTENNWEEVINLADEYGFIHYCYGGVAILLTKENKEKEKAIKDTLESKTLIKFKKAIKNGLLLDEDLEKIDNIIRLAVNREVKEGGI